MPFSNILNNTVCDVTNIMSHVFDPITLFPHRFNYIDTCGMSLHVNVYKVMCTVFRLRTVMRFVI